MAVKRYNGNSGSWEIYSGYGTSSAFNNLTASGTASINNLIVYNTASIFGGITTSSLVSAASYITGAYYGTGANLTRNTIAPSVLTASTITLGSTAVGLGGNLSSLSTLDTLTASGRITSSAIQTGILTASGTSTFVGEITASAPMTISSSVVSSMSSGSVRINSDLISLMILNGLKTTASVAPPTGTPSQGQKLMLRITDDGTARSIFFASVTNGYRASTDLTFPTTTVINKTLYLGFIYNATDSRWDMISRLGNF